MEPDSLKEMRGAGPVTVFKFNLSRCLHIVAAPPCGRLLKRAKRVLGQARGPVTTFQFMRTMLGWPRQGNFCLDPSGQKVRPRWSFKTNELGRKTAIFKAQKNFPRRHTPARRSGFPISFGGAPFVATQPRQDTALRGYPNKYTGQAVTPLGAEILCILGLFSDSLKYYPGR
ncbi:hypothetical protein Dalk_0488 [Desulfatibacillum aliphaticivorans]|uniref:Uncharacterized protein n=1 Tax=Desulfatibacillum aliphaticivorans TaxID=218208 RepID=B8FHA7_DESAL|nr:hypothetical protein Dalk_0488 [Desulfatibacillum aliphaticivorans]